MRRVVWSAVITAALVTSSVVALVLGRGSTAEVLAVLSVATAVLSLRDRR